MARTIRGYGRSSSDIENIDWNDAWKNAKAKRTTTARKSEFWDKRAPSFAKHAAKKTYAEDFIRIMNPDPHWSVLDMASGAGTLAIPLSTRVRRVTAVDFSQKMLDILKEQSSARGITNITTINARWEDDWSACGIGECDVAIASRSLVVDDLRGALLKLEHAARKRVYISTIVGDGPYDRHIFDVLGRPLNMGPDYIYNYNLLHQMGIRADVTFITQKSDNLFESPAHALESIRWMFDNMTLQEEKTLKRYLQKHLLASNGGWRMDYDKTVRWAVIWWDKEEGDCW